MSLATEWALAVHRAVWFPVFWLTGLEAPAEDDPFLGYTRLSPAVPAGSCLGKRSARSNSRSRSHVRPTREARKA